jgi:hypothetical protein
MSCPAVVNVAIPGPPGVGLPSGVGMAEYAVVKDGNTPYLYKLVELEQVGLPQALGITASPTFAGLTLSGFASGAVGIVTSGTNGQLARVSIGAGLSIVNGVLVASGSAGTNLSYDPSTRLLSSSTGDDVTLPLATTLAAGLQSSADKIKLDSITVDTATKTIERVRNTTGVEIPKGAVVRIPSPGSSGTTLLVALADASDELTAANTYGLAQAAIPHNSDGIVQTSGTLSGVNTDHLVEGELVFLSEVAGQTTSTRPTQPAHGVILGWCIKKGPGTSGILAIKVANGPELYELHDVLITGNPPAVGAPRPVLARHSDGLWRNTLITPADTGAATVASTGSYNDLTNKPDLSTKADLVGGVIPTTQIPAIAISDYLGAVNSQAAMLALTGQRGDWCLRTDTGNVGQWILSGDNASILGNWVQVPVPIVPVQSVNGQTGIIVLSAADVGGVSSTDARLSDSREWSAETVGQAEAEARSATTRRAWTAQRVGQAIAAWWTATTTTIGRAVATAASQADARNAIGAGTGNSNLALGTSAPLGLAATAAVGSSEFAAPIDHQHQRDTTTFAIPLSYGTAPAGNSSTIIDTFTIPFSYEIISVGLACETTPVTNPIIVNMTLNGTTIFSTKPQINVGSTTTSNTPVLSITSGTLSSVLRVYIDQAVGGGTFLKLYFTFRRTS